MAILLGVTTMRALLLILLLSGAAAGLAAVASIAPAELRNARPPADATDPSLGATFTEQQVARHGAYRRGAYAAFAISLVLEIAVLMVLARGPLSRLLERTSGSPARWWLSALVAAAVVALATWLAQLPLGYVRGYVVQHAWGLSTQTAAGWLTDALRSLLVTGVIAAIAAVTFFGLVRWQPQRWWLFGWAGFTALTALLFLLYPVLIAPLFNRFTPLGDESLARDIRQLAAEAGVAVDEVLVADASRRSTIENAYVAGLGATKQVVIYDTLLDAGAETETSYVVAHELGHEIEDHILKGLALSSVGLLVGFVALRALSTRGGPWSWAGADGVGDPRALPLLLVFAAVAGLVLLPLQNAISRRFEERADAIALELTDDPDTAIRVHRRLAFSNISDLRPPAPAVWLLYTHPPVGDRIEAAMAEKRDSP